MTITHTEYSTTSQTQYTMNNKALKFLHMRKCVYKHVHTYKMDTNREGRKSHAWSSSLGLNLPQTNTGGKKTEAKRRERLGSQSLLCPRDEPAWWCLAAGCISGHFPLSFIQRVGPTSILTWPELPPFVLLSQHGSLPTKKSPRGTSNKETPHGPLFTPCTKKYTVIMKHIIHHKHVLVHDGTLKIYLMKMKDKKDIHYIFPHKSSFYVLLIKFV